MYAEYIWAGLDNEWRMEGVAGNSSAGLLHKDGVGRVSRPVFYSA